MAFWRKKTREFDKINHIIQQKPGITQADLSRALNVQRSTISRRLPGMEEAGYLYSEDKRGGLWPFKRKR